jgi:serine/threonine protein kinase
MISLPLLTLSVVSARYVVIKKLGWGHFSTVWMVKDRKAVQNNESEQFFALKVQKSAEHYTEAAMDEVELLDCIHKERHIQQGLPPAQKDSDGVTAGEMAAYSKYVATLHDSFFHNGPNGRHMCMVFSMLGCNLLSVIKAFNYRGVPIPVVKNMIRGICKGLDFLHRKCQIIHTDLKPENCLLLYEGNDEVASSMARLTIDEQDGAHMSLDQAIKELEESLQNPSLSQDERKKLKRKLKKKRQKRKKLSGSAVGFDDAVGEDDDDDDDVGDDDDDDDDGDAATASSFLSDWELTRMLSAASNLISPRIADSGIVPDTGSVKRRLKHSPFVTSNFGHRHVQADAKLMGLLQTAIEVRRPSPQELASDLVLATQEGGGGISEIAFMVRAFTPEEELADGVSASLGNIAWEMSADKCKREW